MLNRRTCVIWGWIATFTQGSQGQGSWVRLLAWSLWVWLNDMDYLFCSQPTRMAILLEIELTTFSSPLGSGVRECSSTPQFVVTSSWRVIQAPGTPFFFPTLGRQSSVTTMTLNKWCSIKTTHNLRIQRQSRLKQSTSLWLRVNICCCNLVFGRKWDPA